MPRDASIEVTPGAGGCDIAEVSSPVVKRHPVQFVAFSDVQKDPGLHFAAGGPGCQRELNILIGKNVEAGRLMAGVTFSAPGNWTSWPPHEHAVLAEEAYLYIDMPRAGVWHPARLHQQDRSGSGDHRARRRRRADAGGLPSERGCAGRPD